MPKQHALRLDEVNEGLWSVSRMLQVPILDPGIHVKPGYAPYDSGIKQGVFMRDIAGQPFVGQVQPALHITFLNIALRRRCCSSVVMGLHLQAMCAGVSYSFCASLGTQSLSCTISVCTMLLSCSSKLQHCF